jgi:hypothetical protein
METYLLNDHDRPNTVRLDDAPPEACWVTYRVMFMHDALAWRVDVVAHSPVDAARGVCVAQDLEMGSILAIIDVATLR